MRCRNAAAAELAAASELSLTSISSAIAKFAHFFETKCGAFEGNDVENVDHTNLYHRSADADEPWISTAPHRNARILAQSMAEHKAEVNAARRARWRLHADEINARRRRLRRRKRRSIQSRPSWKRGYY